MNLFSSFLSWKNVLKLQGMNKFSDFPSEKENWIERRKLKMVLCHWTGPEVLREAPRR